MRDLTRIMEDYTDSLPEHITFNSKYIDLHNLRFENENAIKKFLYKIRKRLCSQINRSLFFK
jgi:hypothetical protein